MNKRGDYSVRDESTLRQRISRGSRDPEDYVDLAHLLADLSLYDESIELYKTAIHLASTNIHRAKISADLGWVLFEAGQLSSGEESAEKALSLVADEASGSERLLIEGTYSSISTLCMVQGS